MGFMMTQATITVKSNYSAIPCVFQHLAAHRGTPCRAHGGSQARELTLEPSDLLRQALDDALLHVRGERAVDSLSAQSLLEEAEDGRRAAQLSLVDLVGGWHLSPSRAGIAREDGL